MTQPALPALRVTWDMAVVEEGQVFLQYNVYRRVAAQMDAFGLAVTSGPWVRIATVAGLANTTYDDHGAGNGHAYQYAVTWTANVSGDVLESALQQPPTDGSVTWARGAYLHDVAQPGYYTYVLAREVAVAQSQQQTQVRARGRREPTVFVGEGYARSFDLQPLPEHWDDPAAWRRLRALLDRQYTHGATYCLRLTGGEEVAFGTLAPAERASRANLYEQRVRFFETAYEEAV